MSSPEPQDEHALAGRLIERLLVDPVFRAEFRRDPVGACVVAGLPGLAGELGGGVGSGMETLELRESRSSLAGVVMAAAVEGLSVAEAQAFVEHGAKGLHGLRVPGRLGHGVRVPPGVGKVQGLEHKVVGRAEGRLRAVEHAGEGCGAWVGGVGGVGRVGVVVGGWCVGGGWVVGGGAGGWRRGGGCGVGGGCVGGGCVRSAACAVRRPGAGSAAAGRRRRVGGVGGWGRLGGGGVACGGRLRRWRRRRRRLRRRGRCVGAGGGAGGAAPGSGLPWPDAPGSGGSRAGGVGGVVGSVPSGSGGAGVAGAVVGAGGGVGPVGVSGLLEAPGLQASAQARAFLASGGVDPRVVSVLDSVLAHHSVGVADVVSYEFAGACAGVGHRVGGWAAGGAG